MIQNGSIVKPDVRSTPGWGRWTTGVQGPIQNQCRNKREHQDQRTTQRLIESEDLQDMAFENTHDNAGRFSKRSERPTCNVPKTGNVRLCQVAQARGPVSCIQSLLVSFPDDVVLSSRVVKPLWLILAPSKPHVEAPSSATEATRSRPGHRVSFSIFSCLHDTRQTPSPRHAFSKR